MDALAGFAVHDLLNLQAKFILSVLWVVRQLRGKGDQVVDELGDRGVLGQEEDEVLAELESFRDNLAELWIQVAQAVFLKQVVSDTAPGRTQEHHVYLVISAQGVLNVVGTELEEVLVQDLHLWIHVVDSRVVCSVLALEGIEVYNMI